MRIWPYVPALMLISLTLLGCHKSSGQGPNAAQPRLPMQTGERPQETASAIQPAVTSPVPQAQPQQPSPPLLPSRPTPLAPDRLAEPVLTRARPLSGVDTLMALGREKRTLPEDFKIGPLGDSRDDKADSNGAVSVAEAFLAGVVEGKPDHALVTSESEKTILDTLTYGLKQGYAPSSFRLGMPKVREDGEIAANVRLFSGDGSAEGEIYMTRAGKKWLVADLQLSLAQLAVKRDKPSEKYFPSAYRWLLEE